MKQLNRAKHGIELFLLIKNGFNRKLGNAYGFTIFIKILRGNPQHMCDDENRAVNNMKLLECGGCGGQTCY